jgi:hypothetical protein
VHRTEEEISLVMQPLHLVDIVNHAKDSFK